MSSTSQTYVRAGRRGRRRARARTRAHGAHGREEARGRGDGRRRAEAARSSRPPRARAADGDMRSARAPSGGSVRRLTPPPSNALRARAQTSVVTKYKAAAEIANKALAAVLGKCVAGAKLVDLCVEGDAFIEEQCAMVYNKGKSGEKIEKGLAFPTCVSVNNVVCHCSPLAGDEAAVKEGDVVKVDLGCHIDGWIAVCAHTVCVSPGPADAVPASRSADVVKAAAQGLEAAMRTLRPGNKCSEVTDVLQRVAESYGVKLLEGVLTHQMKRFVIDGNKVVLSVPGPEVRVEDAEFEEHEVYAVDVVMSSGGGVPRVIDEKETTVYKRALDREYNLKLKASRAIFSEINKKYPTMPFTSREIGKDKPASQARLGLVECLNHELLHPYPVLHEKEGEVVAHFKATVLLMPNGVDRITSHPVQEIASEKALDEDIEELLKTDLKPPKKKKNKKKKAKGDGDAGADD